MMAHAIRLVSSRVVTAGGVVNGREAQQRGAQPPQKMHSLPDRRCPLEEVDHWAKIRRVQKE